MTVLTSSSMLLESASGPLLKVALAHLSSPNSMPISPLRHLMVLSRPVYLSSFFRVGLQVIHVKEVTDLSMRGVVPVAPLVQKGA